MCLIVVPRLRWWSRSSSWPQSWSWSSSQSSLPQWYGSVEAATLTIAGVVQFVESKVNVRVQAFQRASVLEIVISCGFHQSVILTTLPGAGAFVSWIV